MNQPSTSKLLKQTSIQCETNVACLDQVLAWFESCHSPVIPQKDWLYCQLALAEGFTNAVRHAHKGISNPGNIEISISLFSERVEIRIWDYGKPFDLKQKINQLAQGLNTHAEGKRGLVILEQIADEMSYFRSESQDRNCLLIVKSYLPLSEKS